MRSLNLQHLDELIILFEDLRHLHQALLIATQPPRVIGALVADKTQDFEQRCPVILNKRAREVSDRDGEQVGVEVSVDVIYGVGEDGWRDGGDSQVRQDGFVGDVGF